VKIADAEHCAFGVPGMDQRHLSVKYLQRQQTLRKSWTWFLGFTRISRLSRTSSQNVTQGGRIPKISPGRHPHSLGILVVPHGTTDRESVMSHQLERELWQNIQRLTSMAFTPSA
jgi:hypothetical protein